MCPISTFSVNLWLKLVDDWTVGTPVIDQDAAFAAAVLPEAAHHTFLEKNNRLNTTPEIQARLHCSIFNCLPFLAETVLWQFDFIQQHRSRIGCKSGQHSQIVGILKQRLPLLLSRTMFGRWMPES